MKRKSIAALFLLAIVSAALLSAQAQRGTRSPMYDPKTETTITGTVEDIQQQAGRGAGSGTHLMLKTDSGSFDVHVGPTAYLEQKQFAFAKGEQIEVTGSKVKLGNTDTILAREIKKDGKVLTLRDAQGIPQWSRARRRAS